MKFRKPKFQNLFFPSLHLHLVVALWTSFFNLKLFFFGTRISWKFLKRWELFIWEKYLWVFEIFFSRKLFALFGLQIYPKIALGCFDGIFLPLLSCTRPNKMIFCCWKVFNMRRICTERILAFTLLKFY